MGDPVSSNRDDALQDIADIAKRHGLTAEDIVRALSLPAAEKTAVRSSGILMRLFGYLGGIFVFAGLCIFGGMVWDDIGVTGRILMTLGVGFCCFVMGVTCVKDARFEKAATPLFLVAVLLQPGGLFVMLHEFSRGGDPLHGIIYVCLFMLIQQGLTFAALQRTVLAFTSLVYGTALFIALCELFKIPVTLSELILSASLLCIAYALQQSRHAALSGFVYFCASAMLLFVSYDILHRKPYEIVFLGIACGLIFVSTVVRSRALLVNGTLAMFAYISYFSARHFENTLGWPLLMILLGFMLIGAGVLAVRINNKFIKQG